MIVYTYSKMLRHMHFPDVQMKKSRKQKAENKKKAEIRKQKGIMSNNLDPFHVGKKTG